MAKKEDKVKKIEGDEEEAAEGTAVSEDALADVFEESDDEAEEGMSFDAFGGEIDE